PVMGCDVIVYSSRSRLCPRALAGHRRRCLPVELSRAAPGTESLTDPAGSAQSTPETDGPWCTVVWNDPVNLMSDVAFVFRRYFGYSHLRAEQLMLQVHEEGRAVVARGSRERAETDVQAMHSFGLQATLEKAGEG